MRLPKGMATTRDPISREGRVHGKAVKPGWSPRKGRRFEFLPRRKPCRNTTDSVFS